jgi:putative FmdB family regulatory protein
MPTYEYRCPEGHVFEKFQKMSERPQAKCPVCGKSATRKISGGAGLVFKGSGFYITDYGKDGKGPRKPESEPSIPSKSESETKTESAKPESKRPPATEGPTPKSSARPDKGKSPE